MKITTSHGTPTLPKSFLNYLHRPLPWFVGVLCGNGFFMPAKKIITYTIDANGCHNCTSHAKSEYGYSRIGRRGVNTTMHRYVYQHIIGRSLPRNVHVLHKCDNPACINPDHLELGSHQDNMRQRDERGRHIPPRTRGERHGFAKLTESDVLKIRGSHSHLSNLQLSKLFPISAPAISRVRNSFTWKHLPPRIPETHVARCSTKY